MKLVHAVRNIFPLNSIINIVFKIFMNVWWDWVFVCVYNTIKPTERIETTNSVYGNLLERSEERKKKSAASNRFWIFIRMVPNKIGSISMIKYSKRIFSSEKYQNPTFNFMQIYDTHNFLSQLSVFSTSDSITRIQSQLTDKRHISIFYHLKVLKWI